MSKTKKIMRKNLKEKNILIKMMMMMMRKMRKMKKMRRMRMKKMKKTQKMIKKAILKNAVKQAV